MLRLSQSTGKRGVRARLCRCLRPRAGTQAAVPRGVVEGAGHPGPRSHDTTFHARWLVDLIMANRSVRDRGKADNNPGLRGRLNDRLPIRGFHDGPSKRAHPKAEYTTATALSQKQVIRPWLQEESIHELLGQLSISRRRRTKSALHHL